MPVKPGIPGPQHTGLAIMNQQHNNRRPHGLAAQVHGGVVTDRMIGALQGGIHRQQPMGNATPEGKILQCMTDHGGGKVAGVMAAHAINNGPQPLTVTAHQRVFIGRPAACVGASLPPPAAHLIALAAVARYPAPDTGTAAAWQPEAGQYGIPATTGRRIAGRNGRSTRRRYPPSAAGPW